MKFVQIEIVGDKPLWIFPGGGIEAGETPLEALKREILEETGIQINGNPSLIWHRKLELDGKKGRFLSDEKYYLIHSKKVSLDFSMFTDFEKKSFIDYKWWSLSEIKATDEPLAISNTYQLLKNLLEKDDKNYPINLCGE